MRRFSMLAAVAVFLLMACGSSEKTIGESAQQLSPEIEQLIQRVENNLTKMNESGQPLWGQTATLAGRMADYKVPAVGIAVINKDKIEWARGYGVRRAGGRDAVTAKTLFHAGSVAKPVSAMATLTLVDNGLIGLDDDVSLKLISWKIPESPYTEKEKVTLRRLLSHSAGLTDGLSGRSSSDSIPDYFTPEGKSPSVTLQQLLNGEAGLDVDGPTRVTEVPGTRYRYANADYLILQLLVEDLTGRPFAEFMKTTVLRPLGMTSSTYEQPFPGAIKARATIEHDAQGRPFPDERLHFPGLAAGGLWTTPADLARFAIEVMRSYRGESNRVLSQEMTREMVKPQISMVPPSPLADSYGLGLDIASKEDPLYVLHTGGTWGSTCILWAYPETGQGAVVMTNCAAANGMIRFEILLSIAMAYGWPMD